MPTVNVFSSSASQLDSIEGVIPSIKKLVAKELSNGDLRLKADNISIRLIPVRGKGMLANIELEITAYASKERIAKQDNICLTIRDFLKNQIDVDEIRVWLILSELGHSWE